MKYYLLTMNINGQRVIEEIFDLKQRLPEATILTESRDLNITILVSKSFIKSGEPLFVLAEIYGN